MRSTIIAIAYSGLLLLGTSLASPGCGREQPSQPASPARSKQTGAAEARQILEAMVERYRNMESYRDVETAHVETEQVKSTMRQTNTEKVSILKLAYRKPGSFSVDLFVESPEGTPEEFIRCDGTTLWECAKNHLVPEGPPINVVGRKRSAPQNPQEWADALTFFSGGDVSGIPFLIFQGQDILSRWDPPTLIGARTRHGKECWLIRLHGTEPVSREAQSHDITCDLYIEKDTGLLLESDVEGRLVIAEESGEVTISRGTLTHSQVEVNPTLPDSLFTYQQPKDAHVVSETQTKPAKPAQ